MKLIGDLNGLLIKASPFLLCIALVFGVMAAWAGLCELLPVARQVISPRGSAQGMATLGACLAVIVLAVRGGKVG